MEGGRTGLHAGRVELARSQSVVRRRGSAGMIARRRTLPRLLSLVSCLTLALLVLAACGRDDAAREAGAGTGDSSGAGATASAPRATRAAYDADSAARGLLPPDLASLLNVEPLLARASDTSAAQGRWCKQDTLPQRRDVRLRFDARSGDTAVTIFARRTPAGELRRAEVLRRLPDRSAVGASWDASERATTVQEFGGGTVKKTTNRDEDAPLARALRYVGRRTLATRCGG